MSHPSRYGRNLTLGLAFCLSLFLSGCKDGDCSNGTCACHEGGSCEFTCDAPPCHVDCEGNNVECIGACGDGECECGEGSNCDFTCAAPPCHASCDEGTECTAACANGTCSCEEGSSCSFTCDAGPCHVECEGNNSSCDGECANGTCSCGPGSSCDFTCTDDNCTFDCAAGAECIGRCSAGKAGEQGCRFTQCAAGSETICPDGETVVCGTDCPPPPTAD